MNLAELRQRVRKVSRVKSPEVNTTPQVEDIINDVYSAISESEDWPFFREEQKLTTTAGTHTYSLASSMEKINYIYLDDPDEDFPVPLRITEIRRIEQYADEVDTDRPEVYARFGDSVNNTDLQIRFAPTPDDAYDIFLRGQTVPAPLSADTDTPAWPHDRYHIAIVYAASAIILDEEGLHGESEAMDARASSVLNRMRDRYLNVQDDSPFVIGSDYRAGSWGIRQGKLWPGGNRYL